MSWTPASTLTTTGPGGGATASPTAWFAACSGWPPPTVTAAFATDRPSAAWSSRWWLIRPESAAGTVSAMTTSGSRSSAAWAMPLTALASPGPRVTTTAPGAPVRSAQVAAMIVAAVSPWARTNRSPLAAAAPTTSRFGPPPGIPNSSRVPAADSAPTMAAALRCEADIWLPGSCGAGACRSGACRSGACGSGACGSGACRPRACRAWPRARPPVTVSPARLRGPARLPIPLHCAAFPRRSSLAPQSRRRRAPPARSPRVPARAGVIHPSPQLKPVGVAVGVEVVDREFQRAQLTVAVQPVDAQHGQAGRAAQPPGDVGGGRHRRGVLQRAVDRSIADPIDQADHGKPGAGAGLREGSKLRKLPEAAAELHREVDAGVAEGHALMQPQEGHCHDGVVGDVQLVGDLQAGQHVQRLDDLHLGVQRHRHQKLDAAEGPQILAVARDGERAAAAHPVDDTLGDEFLEGPAHRLAAQPGGGDNLGLGGQPLPGRVPASGDRLAQVGRHLTVRADLAGPHGSQRGADGSGLHRTAPARSCYTRSCDARSCNARSCNARSCGAQSWGARLRGALWRGLFRRPYCDRSGSPSRPRPGTPNAGRPRPSPASRGSLTGVAP